MRYCSETGMTNEASFVKVFCYFLFQVHKTTENGYSLRATGLKAKKKATAELLTMKPDALVHWEDQGGENGPYGCAQQMNETVNCNWEEQRQPVVLPAAVGMMQAGSAKSNNNGNGPCGFVTGFQIGNSTNNQVNQAWGDGQNNGQNWSQDQQQNQNWNQQQQQQGESGDWNQQQQPDQVANTEWVQQEQQQPNNEQEASGWDQQQQNDNQQQETDWGAQQQSSSGNEWAAQEQQTQDNGGSNENWDQQQQQQTDGADNWDNQAAASWDNNAAAGNDNNQQQQDWNTGGWEANPPETATPAQWNNDGAATVANNANGLLSPFVTNEQHKMFFSMDVFKDMMFTFTLMTFTLILFIGIIIGKCWA